MTALRHGVCRGIFAAQRMLPPFRWPEIHAVVALGASIDRVGLESR
jgi:hypothetical protein